MQVTNEMRIPQKDFVRSFTGQNHLCTVVAYELAQEKLRRSVAVKMKHLRVIDGVSKIVDLEIIYRDSKLYMLLFDFTEHYTSSQPIVQEKNEASIAKSKLDFEKRLLLAKEDFKNKFPIA